MQEITFPKMVANCCRFLCYFCRISRQNQKAMFDHLSYLLENSSVGLGKYMFDLYLILWQNNPHIAMQFTSLRVLQYVLHLEIKFEVEMCSTRNS